ncbi:MAG: DUF4974 domain-containing protein [Muribaculaceae bacterium]|nr:DUF4974 domain-containing protein [Muribaculaceae bacterium]
MDKTERLLEALDAPERYTASEIEEMLNDGETKETFDLLDKTMSSLQYITVPDVEEEWKRFERNHRKVNHTHSFLPAGLFPRNIAATIAILIASTAVAAIVGVGIARIYSRHTSTPTVEDNTETVTAEASPDSILLRDDRNEISAEVVVFDNETLEKIISEISSYYGFEAAFNDEKVKTLRLYFRWDPVMTAEEVVGRLNNFDQIRIVIDGKTIKVD